MANVTRAIADTAGFIPQAWAQRALDILRANMVLAKFVTRDFDFEPGWKGKTLNIPYPGTFIAQDKAADTAVTVQVPTGGSSVALSLSKHKVVDFNIEDVARAQQSVELMDQYLSPAVIAIGNAVEDDLFALRGSLTGTAVGTYGTDTTAANARSARSGLNAALAPGSQRALIVSPKDEIALLADSTLASFWAFARASGISDGELGSLYGFDTYMSQRVPMADIVTLGTQSSGTFTLTYGGVTTSGQAYNVAAATLQTQLNGLSSALGLAPFTVTGTAPYVITVAAGFAHNPITADFSALTTPANASIAYRTDDLAIHRNSLILAVRPFQDEPAGSGVESATAIDAATGLAIRVQRQYSMADRAIRYGVDILYGVSVLRPSLGLIVKS
ncbi:MAG: P22 phage major capsid protein family protein [Actinomycetes bacterium]